MQESGKYGSGPGREFGEADLDKVLQSLRAPGEFSPAPGFYARVMERVESQKQRSIWSVFTEPIFGTRLAFASVALMALLAFALFNSPVPVNEESTVVAVVPDAGAEPLAIADGIDNPMMRAQPVQANMVSLHQMDPAQSRDVVLADLISYQEH